MTETKIQKVRIDCSTSNGSTRNDFRNGSIETNEIPCRQKQPPPRIRNETDSNTQLYENQTRPIDTVLY